jgi:hypothetical protein
MGVFLSEVNHKTLSTAFFPSTNPTMYRTYTRKSLPPSAKRIDIYDSDYSDKIILYIFFGILDAMWQTAAYWLMGAMSNDPAKLAHFAGFCTSGLFIFHYWSLYSITPFQTSHCNPLALQVFGAQMRSNFRKGSFETFITNFNE